MRDLSIFNKDRDIIKIINKVNTIETRYNLAEDAVNRMNLKHNKVIYTLSILFLCYIDKQALYETFFVFYNICIA